MKIEFDPATGESVLRLDVNDKGLLVFALDMALTAAISTKNKRELKELRELLIDSSKQEEHVPFKPTNFDVLEGSKDHRTIPEIDPFEKRMNTYWENPR